VAEADAGGAAALGPGGGALAGRTALVTGGSRGIGRGIALALADAGAAVAITYRRDEDSAREVVARIEAAGGEATMVQAAMEDPDALERAVADANGELGPIDLFVSNAGLASRGNTVADTDPAEMERLFQAHVMGAHRLVRLLIDDLRAAPRGDVVVISSSEVLHARANGAPYNMAKSALEAFALTLAKEEAANGVRVNIVAPGLVATDMGDKLVRAKLGADSAADLDSQMPFGRVTRPEDVGALVVSLTGPSAAMVTGQRVVIDGGTDASPTGAH
jgi:NAD(P)-dependent dehydrogenase (short-subunit alcohol dehydrogenase family)